MKADTENKKEQKAKDKAKNKTEDKAKSKPEDKVKSKSEDKAKSKPEAAAKNETKQKRAAKAKKPEKPEKQKEKEADKTLKKLMKAMEKCQDFKRYHHTLGVEFTAAALAMKYDVPLQSAQIAGLLHDCAKCLSDEKKLAICEKNHLEVTELERRNPYLLHARVGSHLAASEYAVKDADILNAICYHTTGRPGMSTLEKIIFVADYIEPGRKQAPNLAQIRKLAFEDLNAAVVRILSDTLQYLQAGGGEIDPMTRKTFEYYCKQ